MYLEERRQLEKALYFKAVGIPKQTCYQCFLRDRVKIVNLSDGSSCLPRKENGYCGDLVVSPLNARLNALFYSQTRSSVPVANKLMNSLMEK